MNTNRPKKNETFNFEEIKQVVPQRFPFIMLDKVIITDNDSCIAIKNISGNEPYFQGHFPDKAVMPGNLISEAFAQAAAFVGTSKANISNSPVALALTSMKTRFRHPVSPGDILMLYVKKIKTFGALSYFSGEAKVNENIVAESEFSVSIGKSVF